MSSLTDKLNIAIIHDSGLKVGGGRVWLTEICKRLKNIGHNVLVLVSEEGPKVEFNYEVVPNLEISLIPERLKALSSLSFSSFFSGLSGSRFPPHYC